jgi:hypothetical protein
VCHIGGRGGDHPHGRRILLAMLLLHANTVVPTGQLIEVIRPWKP